MRTLSEPARPGRIAPRRMLLMPPAYSTPEEFLREGFAGAVRARGLDVDLVLIEPGLQSVTDRSFVPRLREELLVPARAAGCGALWLGGISLGAYAALACAACYPQELDGLCLFAPYLGSHIVTGEIERAGGVQQWEPGAIGAEDEERRIWHFIKTHGERKLTIHLGLAREDRFGARHRLMAAALAPRDVDIVPGGHDWPAWRSLWERFLDVRFATPRE